MEALNNRFPNVGKYIQALSNFQINNQETWIPPKGTSWDGVSGEDMQEYLMEIGSIANKVVEANLTKFIHCPAKERARNLSNDMYDEVTICAGERIPRLCDYSLEHIVSDQK